MRTTYGVIVVGGGHAGTEAALAPARMGVPTLLLTQNIDTLGQMSCNPAIGGIGKSHLVKEVDALGGVMAKATDHAGIQFRLLNARKGPAVRATRAQADRSLYKSYIRQALENQDNLHIFQQSVSDLIIEDGLIKGVVTQSGIRFMASSVILTVGTFLGGKIHIGDQQMGGGRAGCPPTIALAEKLRSLPFEVGRLKTGTPPRIDGRSIDYSALIPQPGDNPMPVMSFMGHVDEHPLQVPCHISHTTEKTHEIIRASLHKSAIYSGHIESVGPCYCPSIEDKVVRFADKDSHQIFVEPEGLTVHEIYPNGISTSLPFDVQVAFVQSIKGFANAQITRPGYAIEYDYFDPRGLFATLETKYIKGLYFAGQINGTTGYEEAAAQGLIAGINAGASANGMSPFVLSRSDAYIGVLIDDLITQGTNEPYRMFTSRAEYRLMLREDNADQRLTPKGRDYGLVDDSRWAAFNEKMNGIEAEAARLKAIWLQPGSSQAKAFEEVFKTPIVRETNVLSTLKRPEVGYDALMQCLDITNPHTLPNIGAQLETQTKYEGYVNRQKDEIKRMASKESIKLTIKDYAQVQGLSSEVMEKLNHAKPDTIGQASRISGVTPAAVSLLLVHLKKSNLLPAVNE